MSGKPLAHQSEVGSAGGVLAYLVLDLDGFEPDFSSLGEFAAHQVRREARDEAEISAAQRAGDVLEHFLGYDLWTATLVRLCLQLPDALEALAGDLARPGAKRRSPGSAKEMLAGFLPGVRHDRELTIVVPQPEELTVFSLEWLQDLSTGPPGFSLSSVAETTSADPLATLSRLVDHREERLETLLWLLALCGCCGPIDLLCEFLGVPAAERERILDLLDERLALPGVELVTDYQYQHPSFPSHLTYGIRDSAFRKGLLELLTPGRREEMATELFIFLDRRLGPRFRGSARLLANLARFSATTRETKAVRRQLTWWCAPDEAEQLHGRLASDLQTLRLEPEELWDVLCRTSPGWPAFRCIALLNAYLLQPGGVPAYRQGDALLLRSELEKRNGAMEDALGDVRSAIIRFEQDDVPRQRDLAEAHALAARVSLELTDRETARRHWERALSLVETGPSPSLAELSSLHNNLSDLLIALGDIAGAQKHQLGALEADEKLWGASHPRVRNDLAALADLDQRVGNFLSAQRSLERALEIDIELHGLASLEVCEDSKMLADLHHSCGGLDIARQLERRALALEQQLLGNSHARVAMTHLVLAEWAREASDLEDACLHLERALEIERNTSGAAHPNLAAFHRVLWEHLSDLGKQESAHRHLEEALRIEALAAQGD
jgi:tetratricopeptide (TPR) repeat protein